MRKVIVTGSEGLVGSLLARTLEAKGVEVVRYDLELDRDVRVRQDFARALSGCEGIVHLAAVSRVIWGEQDPQLCWATNVGGTQNVIDAAVEAGERPWLVFASSREVYGDAAVLPVREHAPKQAVNVYGRAKIRGEELVHAARAAGLRTSVVRLSNVYGSTGDHADRVVPAFTRAAACGGVLRVDGLGHTFDFTHVSDTVAGLFAICEQLHAGEARLPDLHLLTGQPTTLEQLARLALAHAHGQARLVEAPPRSFDVANFYGDPSRARELLGWRAQVDIRSGVRRMVEDFARELGSSEGSAVSDESFERVAAAL